MPKINVLDKQTAELIAAGEVVERPASAIKELVENSIDSGATHITVEIEHGGIVLMRVTDDGCGIERDDVPKAFLRHATSKISVESDLNSIGTLGFRGEALAAISSVANVTMITKTETSSVGTHYVISGGEEELIEDVGCNTGTVIEVKNLFYNTPARMKFLKKDIKEGANVAAIIDRMALSHPEISFKFIKDGKQTMQTQGNGDLKDAVYSVLGRDIALGTIPLNHSSNGVKVSGLICKPFKCRPNRNLQLIFLNGRFVKSGTVMAALDVAYKNSAMVGKFPYCVLNIEVPYETVDVNVHPSKTEVRFADESRIFDAIRFGAQNAISADTSRPQIDVKREKAQIRMTSGEFLREMKGDSINISSASRGENIKLPVPKTGFGEAAIKSAPKAESTANIAKKDIAGNTENSFFGSAKPMFNDDINAYNSVISPEKLRRVDVTVDDEDIITSPAKNTESTAIPQKEENSEKTVIEKPENLQPAAETPKFIGEAFKTYIIAEMENKIFFVDKHAAHERIIFEKLKQSITPESQFLLTPASITLPKEEYAVIVENLEKLTDAGFEIEDFGDSSVVVRAVPSVLALEDYSLLLSEISDSLASSNTASTEKLERIYHTVACKAAVKAGYVSSRPQLEKLMNEALCNPKIRYCPHGRPVAIEIGEKELQKMFGRIQ